MNPVEEIKESIGLDEKSSHSDRLYNRIALASGISAGALLISSLAAYAVNEISGLYAFQTVFYPVVLLLLLSFVFGIGERLRNRYFTSGLALIIAVVVTLGLAAFMTAQGILYQAVYVWPFVRL